jgi:rare lipoprotein A
MVLKRLAKWILLNLAAVSWIMMSCAKTTPPPSKPTEKPRPYRVGKTWYHPISETRGYRERGIASWYGTKFHGRKTSSGEIYNMYAMTAAHKTLPIGTRLRVKNLDNNKTVNVRINDRGPFVRGRIIDLSYAAAKKIDMLGTGTAQVELVVPGTETRNQTDTSSLPAVPQSVDYYSGNFTFQLGAFRDKTNAIRFKQRLNKTYQNVHITEFDTGQEILYRVRVGKASSLDEAVAFEATLIQNGFKDVFIVAE